MSFSPNLSTYHPRRDSDGTGECTAGKFHSLPAHSSPLVRDSNGTGGSGAGEFEFPPAHTLSLVRDSDDTRDFLSTPAHPSFEAPFLRDWWECRE